MDGNFLAMLKQAAEEQAEAGYLTYVPDYVQKLVLEYGHDGRLTLLKVKDNGKPIGVLVMLDRVPVGYCPTIYQH